MKKRTKTAAELMTELRANPEWAKRRRERDLAMDQRMLEWREAEAPLVRDLTAAGFAVKSVWDLVNATGSYPEAVPILLKHLARAYPERVREGIARALAVPEAHVGWPLLLQAFEKEKDATTLGVKWALACALGASGTDSELKLVIGLVCDDSLGRNRVPLLQVLGRSRDPAAREVLTKLQQDDTLSDDAKKALRLRRRR